MVQPTSLLRSNDSQDRVRALELLWSSRQLVEPVKSIYQLITDDPERAVRWRAVKVMAYQPNGAVKTDSLLAALNDEDYYVHYHAREAIREQWSAHEFMCAIRSVLKNAKHLGARAECADILGRLGVVAREALPDLLEAAGPDAHADIRRQALHALGKIGHRDSVVEEQLQIALMDSDAQTAGYAALSLARLRFMSRAVSSALLAGLEFPILRSYSLSAIAMIIRTEQLSDHPIPQSIHDRAILECRARGILPTVGLKKWNKPSVVRIPAKREPEDADWPWTALDAYHHWANHTLGDSESPLTDLQVCVRADWFPGIHLIQLLQLLLHSGNAWDPAIAPVEIEGQSAGGLIQYAFTLYDLFGMRDLSRHSRTNRIDFAHGPKKSIREIQLLMFAGLSAHFPLGNASVDSIGQSSWVEFESVMKKVLENLNCEDLFALNWYREEGRASIRYGLRYELPYDEISERLVRLRSAIESERAESEIAGLRFTVNAIANRLDRFVVEDSS